MNLHQFKFDRAFVHQLDLSVQLLIESARKATEKSYAPYSKFHVGAAIRLSDGTILTGANHENASFPASICAERCVLGSHDMDSPHKVVAIAIAYRTAQDYRQPLAPCGLCRQTILEVQLHQQSPIAVYMTSPQGEVIMVDDASHLLPFHFSREFIIGE